MIVGCTSAAYSNTFWTSGQKYTFARRTIVFQCPA